MRECTTANHSDGWHVDGAHRLAASKYTMSNNFKFVKLQLTQVMAPEESAPFNLFYACHFRQRPQRTAVTECKSFYFHDLIVTLHLDQLCTSIECPRWNGVDVFSNPHSLHITGNTLLSSSVHKYIAAADAIIIQ